MCRDDSLVESCPFRLKFLQIKGYLPQRYDLRTSQIIICHISSARSRILSDNCRNASGNYRIRICNLHSVLEWDILRGSRWTNVGLDWIESPDLPNVFVRGKDWSWRSYMLWLYCMALTEYCFYYFLKVRFKALIIAHSLLNHSHHYLVIIHYRIRRHL